MSSMSVTARTSPTLSAPGVSLFSLYLLRTGYLLLVVGLGSAVWPALLDHTTWALTLSPWPGVGNSMLCALSLMSLIGLRYPLKMLPLLFFEIAWKAIWLTAVALPLWTAHGPIDDTTAQTIQACLMVAIFLPLIPWRYAFATYVRQPGDRWR